ncbi:MAG: ornithine cyclodeaminase family protein [Deltaproteobacteria bacterium]|nr:ornithine cyclodeaminase family protein [Deltaproteobacteria bacterium]
MPSVLRSGPALGHLLYLSRQDVEAIALPMQQIIDALETMFLEKGAGRTEMPPKPGIHPRDDAFIHAMPAYIPSLQSAGVKWVSGFPQNQAVGLPYIHGLMILNDPETGIPRAVMDCTWITAMRTGAATAVGAKHLARPDSSTVGILACGVQGRSNLEALACLFEIATVRAYDIDQAVAERFAAEMGPLLGVQIQTVSKPEQAVREMDLVVTSGPILKHPTPTIEAGWLAPGAFASPVDFDSYWTPAALAEIDRLATDDKRQMGYYRQEGYFQHTPEPYADLGELALGTQPGRQSPTERTMSINLGLALEDMATAPAIYQLAVERGIGTELPL